MSGSMVSILECQMLFCYLSTMVCMLKIIMSPLRRYIFDIVVCIASWARFLRNVWPNSSNITFRMVSWTYTCIDFCFSLYNSLLKWKYWSVDVRIYWLSYNTSALLQYPIPKCCWHFSKEIVLDGVDGELKTGRIVCTPQSNFIGEETLPACTMYVVHVPGLKLLKGHKPH